MNLLPAKYTWFRLRMMLLYPPALVAMIYYSWIAPIFGRAHVARLRRGIPRLVGLAVLWLNGIHLRVEGAQHLHSASAGPRVLVANHNSRFDGYILLAICPYAFKSFWSDDAHVTNEGFKFVATFGRLFDLFFVHHKSNIRRTLVEFTKASHYLKDGGVVSFFPEGGFSSDGRVRNLGSSCVGLARRESAPITPVVMVNTQSTFENRNAREHRRREVRVVVLPPIDTANLKKTDVPNLANRIENLMNETLALAAGKTVYNSVPTYE